MPIMSVTTSTGELSTCEAKAEMRASPWQGAPSEQWHSRRLPESSSKSASRRGDPCRWASNREMHSCRLVQSRTLKGLAHLEPVNDLPLLSL